MSHRLSGWLIVSMLVGLLSGCGSAPKVAPNSINPTRTNSPSTATSPAVNLPKAGSGRGAYYKDDGPGDSPPPNLELTLDAEPKVEPYSKSGNKPYVVLGKTYTPLTDDAPFSQRGTGSWYGKKFHGQKTSSGELYDMYKMTAAHPTLPIPSYARITNLSNGHQVIVRINDRGPFHTNRIVDLSYTAALKLDYLAKGSSELLLERLLPVDIEKMAENKKNYVPAVVVKTESPPIKVDTVAYETLLAASTAPTSASEPAGHPLKSPAVATAEAVVVASTVATVPVMHPVVEIAASPVALASAPSPPAVIDVPNTAHGYYLQFGAFGLRANAEATFTRLQSTLNQLPPFEIVQQGTLYRLFSGPFLTKEDATDAVLAALRAGVAKPIIVQR